MQRALNAGAIVAAEIADTRDDPVEIFIGDLALKQRDVAGGQPRLWASPKVEDDFKEAVATSRELLVGRKFAKRTDDLAWQAGEE